MFGVRAGALEQRALDLAPGRVAVVQDAPRAVAALAAELEAAAAGAARRGRVEADAQPHQRLDDARRPLDDGLHDVGVAEAGAGDEGVLAVALEGVVLGEHGGDPALCPGGRGVGRGPLGHDRDPAVLCHPQRVEEPGQPAAEHEEVEVATFGHCRRL